MKLVEILARRLKEWPDPEAVSIVQDYDGELKTSHSADIPTILEVGIWLRHNGGNDPKLGFRWPLSSDHRTAIVTRADLEAERARIAKPAKMAGKDGWIRHRGGKCPVEAGVLVDYRMRIGSVETHGRDAGGMRWTHAGLPGDIMAYRLHKPAEQPAIELPEGCGEVITATLESIDGPYEWRDRITEIDASVEALEEERASLVQRLEAEGFRLIERVVQPVEDMSDWRNWKEGDLVKCVSLKGKGFARLTIGKLYEYDGKGCIVDDDGDSQGLPVIDGTALKFHSRPSK